MLVLEILVEMGDKAENKFVRVRGKRTVKFDSADGAFIFRVDRVGNHCPTCGELKEFIKENYVSKFDEVFIVDKGSRKPASSCSNWNDEIMID